MTVQWVAETSLWVCKSLTPRPDEVSVLNKAAGLRTLRHAGRVVSGLKWNALPRDAVRAAVNTTARLYSGRLLCRSEGRVEEMS